MTTTELTPEQVAELREAATIVIANRQTIRPGAWWAQGGVNDHATTIIALLDGYAELQRLNDAQADNLRSLLDGYEARGKEVERLEAENRHYRRYYPDDLVAALRKSEERAAELEKALNWYAEKAEAVSRYLTAIKPDAVHAVLTELSLDAGQRAHALTKDTNDDA